MRENTLGQKDRETVAQQTESQALRTCCFQDLQRRRGSQQPRRLAPREGPIFLFFPLQREEALWGLAGLSALELLSCSLPWPLALQLRPSYGSESPRGFSGLEGLWHCSQTLGPQSQFLQVPRLATAAAVASCPCHPPSRTPTPASRDDPSPRGTWLVLYCRAGPVWAGLQACLGSGQPKGGRGGERALLK